MDANALAGAALTHFMQPENRGGLDELLVASAYRGRGVARELMTVAEAHYRQLGAAGMRLTVREGNNPAERLYESFGYSVVQRRIRMEKDF